ncbi:MAG: hypothetical protein KDA32_09710 [Phycisphaerales bacterium]|nr:hypothetical protein [Phycisphaerales bacterium]
MRQSLIVLALFVTLSAGQFAAAQQFAFNTPAIDRWHYPFNGTPGRRPIFSTFGATGVAGFNDRDGEPLLAWDTGGQIPTGADPNTYAIQSIRVTLTADWFDGPDWPVDMTVDEWFTFDVNFDGMVNGDGIPRGEPNDTDGESNDDDPGRPIEMFGVGFGPTYTASTYTETSAYIGSINSPSAARDPFPFVFDPNGAMLHCEDSVRGNFNGPLGVTSFTPTPWAIGEPIGYTPGAQTIPFDVVFDIDLTQSDGRVRRYFQEQLAAGRVFVVVAGMANTVQMGSTSAFPVFFTKEGLTLDPLAKAGKLEIRLGPAADINGDGCVDLSDLAGLLSHFGATGASFADGDITGDGEVGLPDLAGLLAEFGAGDCG